MKSKRMVRATLFAAMMGTTFQFFGCLSAGDSFWTRAFWTAIGYTSLELVTDSDAVLDIFEGGNVGAAG